MQTMSFVTGTGMFELRHIVFMIISFSLMAVLPILAIKKNVKIDVIHRILLIVGIISESLKVITYIINNEGNLGGYLAKGDLPFHLCSIQIIFILILNFSKNEKIKHALQGFMIPTCLIGGIAAVILATASSRGDWVIGVQYFGFHTAISAYAIYLLAQKEIKFTINDYVRTIVMLVATLFIAFYLNSILYYREFDLTGFQKAVYEAANGAAAADDATLQAWVSSNNLAQLAAENGILESSYWKLQNINFMYVVNPPQDGLPYLAKYPYTFAGEQHDGWLVYIIHYAFLGLIVVSCCYIKPIIEFFKGLKKKPAKAK